MEPWTVKSGSVTAQGRRSIYGGEPCWRVSLKKNGRVVFIGEVIGLDNATPERIAQDVMTRAVTGYFLKWSDLDTEPEEAPAPKRTRKPKANPSIDAERMEARRDWQAARAAYDAAKPPKPLKLARAVATTAGRYLDLGDRSGRQVEHAAHYDATQFLGLAERSAAAVGARANPSPKRASYPRGALPRGGSLGTAWRFTSHKPDRYPGAVVYTIAGHKEGDRGAWYGVTFRVAPDDMTQPKARAWRLDIDTGTGWEALSRKLYPSAQAAAKALVGFAPDARLTQEGNRAAYKANPKPKANPSTRYPKGRAPRSLLAHHFTEYGADLAAYERTVGHLESAGYFVIPSDRAWLKAQTHGAAQNPPARRVRRPLSRGRRL